MSRFSLLVDSVVSSCQIIVESGTMWLDAFDTGGVGVPSFWSHVLIYLLG